MIKEVIMYAVFCDSCGKQHEDEDRGHCAWTDKISARDVAMNYNDGDWQEDTGKHYCKDCWYWDDNDELVFGKPATPEFKEWINK